MDLREITFEISPIRPPCKVITSNFKITSKLPAVLTAGVNFVKMELPLSGIKKKEKQNLQCTPEKSILFKGPVHLWFCVPVFKTLEQ